MNIALDLEEDGKIVHSVATEVNEDDTVEIVAGKLAALLEIDLDELLDDLRLDNRQVDCRWLGRCRFFS